MIDKILGLKVHCILCALLWQLGNFNLYQRHQLLCALIPRLIPQHFLEIRFCFSPPLQSSACHCTLIESFTVLRIPRENVLTVGLGALVLAYTIECDCPIGVVDSLFWVEGDGAGVVLDSFGMMILIDVLVALKGASVSRSEILTGRMQGDRLPGSSPSLRALRPICPYILSRLEILSCPSCTSQMAPPSACTVRSGEHARARRYRPDKRGMQMGIPTQQFGAKATSSALPSPHILRGRCSP